MTAIQSGITINDVAIPALRTFWGHDLRWWRDAANAVMVWFLIATAVSAAGVVVCTKLVLNWSSEIEGHDAKMATVSAALTDLKVAEAKLEGIRAGEKAGRAEAGLETAQVKIAEANKEAAQARLEAERIKQQVSWRVLSATQLATLTRAGATIGVPVYVDNVDDVETIEFASQVANALHQGGTAIIPGMVYMAGGKFTGVMVTGPTDQARRLLGVLKAAGIPVGMTTDLSVPADTPRLKVGLKPRPTFGMSGRS